MPPELKLIGSQMIAAIVPARDQSVLRRNRQTRRLRDRETIRGQRTRLVVHEDIRQTVEMTFEFEDFRSPGDRLRDADGKHSRLDAGRRKADKLSSRDDLRERLGQLAMVGRFARDQQSARKRLVQSATDRGMAVPEDRRTVGETQIDVATIVDVEEIGSVAPVHEDWMAQSVVNAQRSRNAADQDIAGGGETFRMRGELRLDNHPVLLHRLTRYGAGSTLIIREIARPASATASTNSSRRCSSMRTVGVETLIAPTTSPLNPNTGAPTQ